MPRRDEITLSPKYGVNPSVGICWICGDEDGSVLLPGRMKNDQEAPRHMVSGHPCERCESVMKIGIMLIECTNESSGQNPDRTGRIFGVTEDAVRRIFESSIIRPIMEKRVAYINLETVEKLGLDKIIPTGLLEDHG